MPGGAAAPVLEGEVNHRRIPASGGVVERSAGRCGAADQLYPLPSSFLLERRSCSIEVAMVLTVTAAISSRNWYSRPVLSANVR
jgi:hypothetical protein